MPDRVRAGLGRRAAGVGLALLIELLLALLLLTLRPGDVEREEDRTTPVFTMEAPSAEEPAVAEPEPARPAAAEEAAEVPEDTPAEPPALAPPAPTPPVVTPVQPPVPLPYIPMPRDVVASSDVARPAPAPARPARRAVMGPPDTGTPGDTERVGTAPNGEPLYAASWYREPYPEELRGYLSTATGPGWGLIACRTAPDYRVEDCVSLGESPDRSNIARAVLAAAWQFRVRPPRIGGRPRIGEWVRIRIDYGIERRRAR
ncbi:hypothetical protein [Sphingomonas sp. IW22]|uniref:hypothetical protein n=1 Tax=Sphingomonas sp. IW22 TaxID=3242489 RepID=UPI003522E13E